MADIRINALATTAASTASDDYVAIDGSANGTRKLSAYSPTFGGNLTVSGTSLVNAPINVNAPALQVSSTDNDASGLYLKVRSSPGSANARNWAIWNNYNSAGNLDILRSTTNTGAPTTTAFSLDSSSNATLAGNLTVSGGTARFQDSTGSYGVTITTTAAKTLVETLFGGSSLGIRVGGSGSDSLTIASTVATIRDNLTVSGGTITGGTSGMSLASGGTNQNITLTPSGTGLVRVTCSRATAYSSSLTGDVVIYNPDQTDNGYSSLAFGTRTSAGGVVDTGSAIASITTNHVGASFATQLAFLTRNGSGTLVEAGRFTNGGNVLIGTTSDSANGKLQLATHTTSAGGIGFGTDTSLYRQAAGTLILSTGSYASQIASVSAGFYIGAATAGMPTVLTSGGGSPALTLDSSQNATFAGTVQVNASSIKSYGAAVDASISSQSYGGNGLEYYFKSKTSGNLAIGSTAFGDAFTITRSTNAATFSGAIAIGNTVQTAAAVASTHKVTISIGGSTYYLLATNV